MPAYYDEKRKHWRWRYRGRICGIKVCLTGTPAHNARRAAEQDERLTIERKRKELESPILTREIPIFTSWVETYLEHRSRNISAGSVALYRRNLKRHAIPRFGKRRLDEISRTDLQCWINELRNQYSNSYVRSIVVVMLGCLKFAEAEEVLLRVPKVELPPNREIADDFLSEEEILSLLAVCRTPEERLIIVAGARGGLRNGEIRGLQPGDWAQASRTLRIMRQVRPGGLITGPKGDKCRVIPVHADLAEALAAIPPDQPWCLVNRKTGGPWTERILNRRLSNLARRAGGEALQRRIHAHLLRHTAASHLAIRGVSLYIIAEILGHSSQRTTERYAKLCPSATVSAIDLIPAATLEAMAA